MKGKWEGLMNTERDERVNEDDEGEGGGNGVTGKEKGVNVKSSHIGHLKPQGRPCHVYS